MTSTTRALALAWAIGAACAAPAGAAPAGAAPAEVGQVGGPAPAEGDAHAAVAAATGSPLFLSSAEQGSWIAADKELHAAGSLAVAASLRIEGQRTATALAATMGAGLLKEIYDVALKPRSMRRGASWKDLVADLVGALAGIALVSVIDR